MSSLIISYEESEVGRARYRAGIQMLADLGLEEIARKRRSLGIKHVWLLLIASLYQRYRDLSFLWST